MSHQMVEKFDDTCIRLDATL